MRSCLWIAVLVTACSRPHVPAAAPPPSGPAPIAPVATTVPAAVVASPPGEADEEPIDDELESRLERAQIHGEGIAVDVSWWTLTGTTHVADELVIKTTAGTLRLTSDTADEEQSEALPLIERVHSVGTHRWVLLGWSSFGSGMQTTHAWLVEDGKTPRVVDKLEWTTDRSHAGLAVEVSRKIEIGVPLPADTLHDPEGWLLAHGTRSYALGKVKALPSHRVDLDALTGFYTPPFQAKPAERQWTGAFIWFSADKRFTLQKL